MMFTNLEFLKVLLKIKDIKLIKEKIQIAFPDPRINISIPALIVMHFGEFLQAYTSFQIINH